MNPTRLALALSWPFLALLCVPCPAQTKCTITRITGEQGQVAIQAIQDGVIQSADSSIALDQLMVIQTNHPATTPPLPIRIHLSGGGELTASKVTFTGEQFDVTSRFGKFSLPPDAIRGIVWKTDVDLDRFTRLMANRTVDADMVIANTSRGQGVVQGLIENINQDRLQLNYEGQSRPISLSKIIGIVTADLKPATPDLPRGMVKLVDGSTISAGIGNLNDGVLSLRLPGNATIQMGWNHVSMLSLASDRVQWLSDLTPVEAEQTSLATVEFGWQRDLSVEGNPLRLYWPGTGSDVTYAKGIGTHSASRIEFANTGDFDRFVAIVGIDAETGGKGDE